MRFLAIPRNAPPSPATPLVADEMELQTNSVGTVRTGGTKRFASFPRNTIVSAARHS